MSQYGGNKSAPPPWAQTPAMLQRPAFSEASSTGSIRAAPITYQTPQPLGQQTLLQQPGLTPAMLMQQQIQQPAQVPYGLQFQAAQQQALLSQAGPALGAPGIALPTTLASSQPVMTVGSGAVAYPAGRNLGPPAAGAFPGQQLLQQQQQQQQPKQRVFTGTITKLHDNFGFVDEDVFFQTNCIRGSMPKVGERVLVEAQYNANMPFKWNATRIQLLPNQSASSTSSGGGGTASSGGVKSLVSTGTGSGGGGSGSGSGGMTGARSQALLTRGPPGVVAGKGGAGAYSSVPPPSDQMPQSGSALFGGATRLPHSGRPRSPIRRVRGASREKERRRSRERDGSSGRRRSRSRSPRRRRAAPRYSVHVPKVTLDMTDATVLTLKKRYNNLYVPSDFFSSRFLCGSTFPRHRPFQLATPVTYHVMSKDVDPVTENDAVYEPSDVDYRFCAKVMLLTTPTWEDLYRRTTSLAELGDDADDPVHPSRLVSFLVGLRGKNETMAIGGPWSPSRDGADPESDPQVLIRTAIRTCKALTGVDLSQCTKWYRVTEIYYRRGDKSTETVVLYLPDTATLLPSRVSWEKLQAAYRQALEAKLNPASAQDEKDEDDGGEVTAKQDPTNWSELDPKNMKVAELKQELELRQMSPKGLKSQLIARLTKVLKTEEEKEEEGKTGSGAAKTASSPPVEKPAPEKGDKGEKGDEDEDTRRREESERRSLEKKYRLPDNPQVLVHPHRSAKSGRFDCTVMSLSVLLDYRPEDNKEHSFEVSLFAEVFNEMLMRDAGFAIYRALMDAPEKVKEEKKSKDKKEEDKKEGDEEKKKDDKEESEEKKEEDGDASGEGSNMYTVDKRLLMAFAYFDTSHCGYIIDRDLEDILQTVGLGVSRAQVRRLVAKVADRDSVQYRRLTDKPTEAGVVPPEPTPPSEEQLLTLAAGNWRHLPAFAQPKAEGAGPKAAAKGAEGEEGKPVMVMYEGSMVDLTSLMSRVQRSDSTLAETEKRMSQLQDEVRSAQEEASMLRGEVKTLDQQLQLSRGTAESLESQLNTSQSTVGKYGSALDAVYAAVAPLVAEAESRSAEQRREQERAEEERKREEGAEDMETEADGDKNAKENDKESTKEDAKGDGEAKVKEETPESAKEGTPKTKRTRTAATPDTGAKKAKVENGSSA